MRVGFSVVLSMLVVAIGAAPSQAAGPTAIGADSAGVVYAGFAGGGQIKRYQGNDGAPLPSWGTPGSAAGQIGGVVALDAAPGSAGNIWILDTNRRVQEFSRTGQFVRGIQLDACDSGVTPDPLTRGGLDVTNDDVFVAHPCANSVLRLNKSDLQTVSTGSLSAPKGISAQLYPSAPEPTRRTYVGQPSLNRATKLQPSLATDGSVGTTGSPTDTFIDAFGVLFVSERTENKVRLYDSNGGEFRWIGGTGSDIGKLDNPTAIDVFEQTSDLAGNVFVADYANKRIQRFNPYGYTFWAAAADDAVGGGGSSAPVNTDVPTITGTPVSGSPVTCSDGTWSNSPTSFTYTWSRNGTPIAGATASPYTIQSADVSQALSCTVTATNTTGSGQATSAPVTPTAAAQTPVNSVPPAITGTPSPNNTLACSTGTWSDDPTAYAYQWQLDGAPISGATAATYAVAAGDAGHTVTCSVTATNATGSGQATSAPVTITTTACASGRVGVTINNGAQFTNDPTVTITAHEPAGVFGIWIAGDGAFDIGNHPSQVTCTDTYQWYFAGTGSERLPKTIYVRFGDSEINYTDDIIVDTRPPSTTSASLRGRILRVAARDASAGVGRLQIAGKKTGPFKTIAYKRVVRVSGAKAARWVRAIDRAGNYSSWRQVRQARQGR
ncbi:hypothetical protein DSM112329_02785 [Paraconexibacter sp. AEG42_29]|uniref:Ig-like domain-containing protein n=1 Tax=Paraconexibacter sp. AEG42_29 TaxID=2997339 RepID=A0AAU7AWT9_9ACTN